MDFIMFNIVVKLKDSRPSQSGGNDLRFFFQLELHFCLTLWKHIFETATPRACSVLYWPTD